MMLNRRVPRSGSPPHHQGSMSRAQFHTAVESYQSLRQPANRLAKPSVTSGNAYSYYENTSRRPRHSSDVSFPPVYRTFPKTSGSPRRAKRGTPRKLPRMRSKTNNGRQAGALYHHDGTVNLEALAHLGERQSFPRTQSYYDRLQRISSSKTCPHPPTSAAAGKSGAAPGPGDADMLIPLPFLDDDQLTPRRRAQRDSFLATLLNADDLTDDELSEIAHYFIPEEDDPEESEEATPRPCLKKSPRRPQSAAGKKGSCHSQSHSQNQSQSQSPPQRSHRPKSVRFLQSSPPLPPAELPGGSPRPRSSPGPGPALEEPQPQPSDPFHVASPLPSPRALSSPDEVAYLPRVESPPSPPRGVPASRPEPRPEPKVTYYNEAGEEIVEEEEESRPLDDGPAAAGGEEEEETGEGGGGSRREESSPPRPAGSSPRSESGGRRSASSPAASEPVSDPPEHMAPELDTPRVNREPLATRSGSPRSDESTPSDSSRLSPRRQGLSDSSSESPRRRSSQPRGSQSSPAQNREISPGSVGETPRTDSPTAKEEETSTSPRPASTTQPRPDSSAAQAEVPPPSPPTKPRPESAPGQDSPPRPSKKLRPKSAKRSKASPECLSKPAAENKASTPQGRTADPSEDAASPEARASAESAEASPEKEPLPIPVISLTRGQLPPVPPQSPPCIHEASGDTQLLDSAAKPQPEDSPTDSLGVRFSPRSSTLHGADSSSSLNGSTSPEKKNGGKRDDRMKIWLTKTSWDRHVECVE